MTFEIKRSTKNMQVEHNGSIVYLTYDLLSDVVTVGYILDSFMLDNTVNKTPFIIGLKKLGINVSNNEAVRLLYLLTR
ncbi:Hypothetical protein KNT65_gp066 [Escherichia phage EcS1]|uniref:Uncharacterized protein n=1 Tax=Escherichia phage EcS1 TaxID=2083276 RepID=A0A2Z5ZCD0_9CAUD|nr:Hypothetical protein KNT65_gp066 [Escherichia phage EcS1]BBC78114.1 Hypothetical protein [Escherichia phage EcS1]